jgi:hypothetical protein
MDPWTTTLCATMKLADAPMLSANPEDHRIRLGAGCLLGDGCVRGVVVAAEAGEIVVEVVAARSSRSVRSPVAMAFRWRLEKKIST